MDILLIIITLITVIGIAYILSRPFAKPQPALDTFEDSQNFQRQYEDLLMKIKTLQDECENLNTPEEICHQIEEKKQLAANLLRQMEKPVEDQAQPCVIEEPADSEETQPEDHFLHGRTYICPQCGNRVVASDKFCTHCGNRLQP